MTATRWRKRLGDGTVDVKPITEQMLQRGRGVPGGTIAVPTPGAVQRIVARIPRGRVATAATIAEVIARENQATIGCAVTTGISAWIVANAAEEDFRVTDEAIPWWRVVKPGGELNPKYPGGGALQQALLEAEGIHVSDRRRRSVVDLSRFVANEHDLEPATE